MGCGFAFFVAIKWGDNFSARWIWKKFSSFFVNGYKNAVLAGYHLRGENSLGWIKKWGGPKWPTPKSETKNEKNQKNFCLNLKKSPFPPATFWGDKSLNQFFEKSIWEKIFRKSGGFCVSRWLPLEGENHFQNSKKWCGSKWPRPKNEKNSEKSLRIFRWRL